MGFTRSGLRSAATRGFANLCRWITRPNSLWKLPRYPKRWQRVGMCRLTLASGISAGRSFCPISRVSIGQLLEISLEARQVTSIPTCETGGLYQTLRTDRWVSTSRTGLRTKRLILLKRITRCPSFSTCHTMVCIRQFKVSLSLSSITLRKPVRTDTVILPMRP